jgi:hypothetical protein
MKNEAWAAAWLKQLESTLFVTVRLTNRVNHLLRLRVAQWRPVATFESRLRSFDKVNAWVCYPDVAA